MFENKYLDNFRAYGGKSIEKRQIIFSKIFLIFKLKYLNNYLFNFNNFFFILILTFYKIKIKKIY